MTNVIGLKGSKRERLQQWRTMLMLREDIKVLKEESDPKKKYALDKEKETLDYIFKNYTRAA